MYAYWLIEVVKEKNNFCREGAVQVLQGGDWTDALLVLTLDNVLDVYEDASRNIRIDQVDISSSFLSSQLEKKFRLVCNH